MAQENTAINNLIHLVTGPRVERESHDELFWARNQANVRKPPANSDRPPVRPVFFDESDTDDDALTVRVDHFMSSNQANPPHASQAMPHQQAPRAGQVDAHASPRQPDAPSQVIASQPRQAIVPDAATVRGMGSRAAARTRKPRGTASHAASTVRGYGSPQAPIAPGATQAPNGPVAHAAAQAPNGRGVAHAAAQAPNGRGVAHAAAQASNGRGVAHAAAQASNGRGVAHAAAQAPNGPVAHAAAQAPNGRGVAHAAAQPPMAHRAARAPMAHVAAQAPTLDGAAPVANATHMSSAAASSSTVGRARDRRAAHDAQPAQAARPQLTAQGTPLPGRLPTRPSMRPTMPLVHESTTLDATVRVDPLPLADEPSGFLAELGHAARRFAIPLAGLVVLAVFAGGYVAFDGQGGKRRTPPAATVASSAVDRASAPNVVSLTAVPAEPRPSLSAVIEARIAEARIREHAIALTELQQQPAAGSDEAVRSGDAADAQSDDARDAEAEEIEMAPVAVKKHHGRRHGAAASRIDDDVVGSRTARREKRAAEKREIETQEREVAKREKRDATKGDAAAEGTLPENVANKTDSATGKLAVSSNVPAMIYLDGRSTKMMTPKKFAVPAGAHKITLLEPTSGKAKTQDVDIVAGKVASIDKEF